MLKVQDNCKKAIDAYFQGLDDLDNLRYQFPGEKEVATARFTKNALAEPRFRDKVAEFVVNSYISGLGTLAVNAMSALVKAPLLIAERFIMGFLPGSNIAKQESAAMLKGFFEGMSEGVTMWKAGWAEGRSLDTKANTDYIQRAIGTSADASQAEKIAGKVIRTPTQMSAAIDEFSKAIFRRMQLNAMSARVANAIPEDQLGGASREAIYNQLRQAGGLGNTEWRDVVRNAWAKAPESTINELVEFTTRNTFQAELGKIGNTMMRLRAEHPELVFVAPFIKTPINILKDALSYTPASLFMKQFKGRKDEAFARTLLGAGIASMAAYQVFQGNLTGAYPKDPERRSALQAAGVPEYSVKIGDQWYSYARVEPLATLMGVFSDFAESIKETYGQPTNKTTTEKIEKTAIDAVLAVTQNLTSKTFLEGITGVLQAAHDPERYGGQFINGFAGLVVPAAVAQFARVPDPYQREVRSFGDALSARIPGLRSDLPIRSDILGEPLQNPAYGLMGGIGLATREAEQTPLQKEIQDTNFDLRPVDKKLRGVELTPEQYSQYAQLAGERVNAMLENTINTPLYQSSTPLRKKYLLELMAKRGRAQAAQMMFGTMVSDPNYREEFLKAKRFSKGIEDED
jgi:hypothetical protein